jgi:regulator of RNase E activity RraA
MATLSAADLKALTKFDTPTICNALEVVAPQRRLHGYNIEPLRCLYPDLPPIVGYARTGTIRACEPSFRKAEEDRAKRLEWYSYVDKGPKPSIILLQDLDGVRAGYGSFWGEVNSHVHRGLGALGVITNGSVRDIPMNAKGFQMLAGSVMPSHAYVHVVDVGVPVTVSGMAVKSGDLIHADMHGAVVIPTDVAKQISNAVKLLTRREAVIIGASKKKGFSFETLARAMQDSADIH